MRRQREQSRFTSFPGYKTIVFSRTSLASRLQTSAGLTAPSESELAGSKGVNLQFPHADPKPEFVISESDFEAPKAKAKAKAKASAK